ncbi:hypothetical protein OG730_40820 [Streptomyces sp. NBC_01298]|uniref:hypothetical protein n=1 Tax=Streptomyces sp. NBC_01298 TaxID=2903817 RepID=UPI002E1359A5|nr:hypothetical protein OG730_40820 [Streptomyces sp. NBC_01298]
MKGFRTAVTVVGAAVALGIVGTAVAPVAAVAAPAARAAVVAGAAPDAWMEVYESDTVGSEEPYIGWYEADGTWRVRHVDTDAQHFASTSHTVHLDVRGGTAP